MKSSIFFIVFLTVSITIIDTAPVYGKEISMASLNLNSAYSRLIPMQTNKVVEFKDKNLEKEIRKKINKYSGNIVRSEVEKIEALNLSRRDIKALDGIEYFINLKKLNLAFNKISNIEDLSTLTKLTTLDLGNNKLTNVKPLSHLYNLMRLDISNNRIKDILPLRLLPEMALISIDFSGNPLPRYVFVDKFNQEYVLNSLAPYIQSAIYKYYGEARLYNNAEILRSERFQDKYILRIKVETFTSPHNPPYGIETMTIIQNHKLIRVDDFKHNFSIEKTSQHKGT
jgi:Leucine-rich repeat (LRR) protein